MFVSRFMAVLAAGAALAPVALTAAPLTVVDNDTSVTRSVSVRTDDINLASAAAARTLHARIRQAADQACSIDGFDHAAISSAKASCKRDAMTNAQSQAEVAMARSTPRYASNPAPAPIQNTASGS